MARRHPRQQLDALPSRWFGYISDQNLLAIPFFVYMGSIFEKSGQAERLLTGVGRLMGPIRGGVALTVVVVGTMLAAATGVVAATVIMMGLISLPAMVRYGYDHRLGDRRHRRIGHARPADPSEPRADRSRQHHPRRLRRRSVPRGDRPRPDAVGALRPLRRVRRPRYPEKAPALPIEERHAFSGWALANESLIAIVPPIALIVCVLGAIFQGIATPSEVGSVGAVVAALLALMNRPARRGRSSATQADRRPTSAGW